MGSGSSRMNSRPRTPRRRSDGRRGGRGLAALLCGAADAVDSSSSSNGANQIENKSSQKLVVPARGDASLLNQDIQACLKEPGLSFAPENKPSSSSSDGFYHNQSGAYRERTNGLRSSDPFVVSLSSGIEALHSERTTDFASTYRKSEFLDTSNSNQNSRPEMEVGNHSNYHVSRSMFSSSLPQLDNEELPLNGSSSVADHSGPGLSIRSSVSVTPISNSSRNWNSSNEELVDSTSFGSDDLSLSSSRERYNGTLLHVDLLSISSGVPSAFAEMSNTEAQRNARRLFWDSFSRHSSRRTVDSLASILSTEDADDLEPRQSWLLNNGDRAFDHQLEDDSVNFRRRRRGLSGPNWHLRSEIREQIRAGSHSNLLATSCLSGIHPDGGCSCNALLMPEMSSSRASVARIVLLAEALFEVLDEIHRQPGPLSLSVASAPASQSVVNSLPSRNFKKIDTLYTSDDVEQCYICLSEYEDGEEIRLLPCHHEFHLSCIDKWLKEVHGVCPLCRRDVCQGAADSSIQSL